MSTSSVGLEDIWRLTEARADGGTFFQALLQLRGVYGKNVVLRPYAHNGKGLFGVENAVAFQGDGVDGKPVVFEDVIFPEKNDSPD